MAILKIDSIRLYKFSKAAKRDNYFVKICCGEYYGYGEIALYSKSDDAENSVIDFLRRLYGKSVKEALEYLFASQDSMPAGILSSTELAILDLQGKIAGKNIAQLLNIEKYENPIIMYCIDTNDKEKLFAFLNKLKGSPDIKGIKIRISADAEENRNTVSQIREIYLPSQGILAANANFCYTDGIDFSTESTGVRLLKLHALGLDIVEDPCDIPKEKWKELSEFVSPFAMEYSRAYSSLDELKTAIDTDCATVYKLKPYALPSVLYLNEALKNIDKNISFATENGGFIGIGITQWQILSALFGCIYTECVIKAPLSNCYTEALSGESSVYYENGCCGYSANGNGFGIELDERTLAVNAVKVIDI